MTATNILDGDNCQQRLRDLPIMYNGDVERISLGSTPIDDHVLYESINKRLLAM
jgi:hypothetical protein